MMKWKWHAINAFTLYLGFLGVCDLFSAIWWKRYVPARCETHFRQRIGQMGAERGVELYTPLHSTHTHRFKPDVSSSAQAHTAYKTHKCTKLAYELLNCRNGPCNTTKMLVVRSDIVNEKWQRFLCLHTIPVDYMWKITLWLHSKLVYLNNEMHLRFFSFSRLPSLSTRSLLRRNLPAQSLPRSSAWTSFSTAHREAYKMANDPSFWLLLGLDT